MAAPPGKDKSREPPKVGRSQETCSDRQDKYLTKP
jgi:hypothetical protein